MTPGARYAAAIGILDRCLGGEPAERVLTNWARRSRFAGSGDRAAIRDLVFAALRRRLSYSALGGSATGRGMMIGHLRAQGLTPEAIFTGQGYAPESLTGNERQAARSDLTDAERADCPAWLLAELMADLGGEFTAIMDLMKRRAAVFVRVNRRKATPPEAVRLLAGAGIDAVPDDLSPTALRIVSNKRKISDTVAYRNGLIEFQDAASQWVCDRIPVRKGDRVLDYCAGGGGKTLALAARTQGRFHAHDANARRMSDLPARAQRAVFGSTPEQRCWGFARARATRPQVARPRPSCRRVGFARARATRRDQGRGVERG